MTPVARLGGVRDAGLEVVGVTVLVVKRYEDLKRRLSSAAEKSAHKAQDLVGFA
jgi:hypothetical protein